MSSSCASPTYAELGISLHSRPPDYAACGCIGAGDSVVAIVGLGITRNSVAGFGGLLDVGNGPRSRRRQ